MARLRAYYTKDKVEAGCDEAGRGCLAGPVFAAAVILPKKFKNPLLRDSKKLTAIQRNELYDLICDSAIDYAIQKVSCKVIDKINILNASIKAMNLAVEKLRKQPELLLKASD